MKVLLLTDIPPRKTLTAGLVLDQLCRFLPRGSIVCFTVINPCLTARLSPDLEAIPIKYVGKPNESGVWWPRGPLGFVTAYAAETRHRLIDAPRLVKAAASFARQHGVDRIWAVLQGQTILRMAEPLAGKLGLPLYTQVWDPLSWWLSAHRVDRLNALAAHHQFDRTLRRSTACAVASSAMAEDYASRYGTKCVPVLASHPRSLGQSPPLDGCAGGTVTVGMAGQFYAAAEWSLLIHALNTAGWQVEGKEVRIKVLGAHAPHHEAPPGRVEFLGWMSQPEAIQTLSGLDVLYCPYPFDRDRAEVSRLSFPSKLPLYLAAGRPILFHGPADSSPSRYLARREAALCCGELELPAIYNALNRLVADAGLYRRVALNGQRAFQEDFVLEVMRERFWDFLDVPSAGRFTGENAHAPQDDTPALNPGHVAETEGHSRTSAIMQRR